jgi:pimeloyl-ACP methyl ester carboxylesterase
VVSVPGTESARDPVVAREKRIAVLFLHGQPGLGSDFDLVVSELGGGFRAISPDRPGYGNSNSPASSIRQNARIMADLLDSLGLSEAVVVGHSYGGGIAAVLAHERPDLVSGLVLAASVGHGDSLGVMDRVLASHLLGDVLIAGGIGAASTLLPVLRSPGKHVPGRVGRWLGTSLPDARFARVAHPLGGIWKTVASEQRALFAESDLLGDALSSITVPTEVVTGTWDLIVPPGASAAMAAGIRSAELVLVPGTGHFLTRDAPKTLARVTERVAARVEMQREAKEQL